MGRNPVSGTSSELIIESLISTARSIYSSGYKDGMEAKPPSIPIPPPAKPARKRRK